MSLHDAYARLTPFEIAFPDEAELETLAETVRSEATARGVDVSDPPAFLTLGAVAEAVRGLGSPDDGPGERYRFGSLVFHALHFLEAGRPLYLAETALTRSLVSNAPLAPPEPPSEAGYLQLPQHLFWVGDSGSGSPESIDGGFWTVSQSETLHVLLVTGLRPDRPGFGAFPLQDAPLVDAPRWLEASVRETGDDFASTLEGGDLDGLYAVEAAGEALKLLARFFAYVREHSGGLDAAGPVAATADGPRPSGLPYTRVELVA